MRKEEILKFIAAFENSEFFFQLNNSAKMRCVSFFNLKMELVPAVVDDEPTLMQQVEFLKKKIRDFVRGGVHNFFQWLE